jgi:hypothetical protein
VRNDRARGISALSNGSKKVWKISEKEKQVLLIVHFLFATTRLSAPTEQEMDDEPTRTREEAV